MADSQQRGSSDNAVWIRFKGTTRVLRLDQLSVVEEMMLERGKPYEYVNINGVEAESAGTDMDDGEVLVVDNDKGSPHLMLPDSQPEHHMQSGDDDGWNVVAGSALEEVREQAQRITEADVWARLTDDEDDESDQDGTRAVDRVRRFEAKMKKMQETEDDPFWLPHFFEIIEKLSSRGFDSPNYQKSLTLLSGCTGLFSEGWVCQARYWKFKVDILIFL